MSLFCPAAVEAAVASGVDCVKFVSFFGIIRKAVDVSAVGIDVDCIVVVGIVIVCGGDGICWLDMVISSHLLKSIPRNGIKFY